MATPQEIKTLRERTNAGILDCKNALEATNGDMDKAVDWLREKGKAAVAKKEGRIAAEGIVDSYIHLGGKIGVLVEVNCETDFVAKNPAFREFAHNIALQIAASKPLFVAIADVDEQSLAAERKIYLQQAINEGKPEQVAQKIVEGRINKYYQEVCLLEQPYFKDMDKKVKDILNETVLSIGEKITIRRFVRFEMGEGLQKRQDNFAEEIQKQIEETKNKNN